tara:strand:- start:154 stop:1533 length:1380 start_codon:yes stop_codon:yes gene_type:complete
MSSFQFPTDPADGTVLVRGDLQATYDEPNNTWVVSQLQQVPGIEGPKGDKGDKGDPGAGVSIGGSVATVNDLPPSSTHQGEFWIVDSTNTLYYSDGNSWLDLGGPIQGADGTDGVDGQGWTSVTALTTANSYRLQFDSDTPSLAFTTPNLKGADAIAAAGAKDVVFMRATFPNEPVVDYATFETFGATSLDPWVDSETKTVTMPADADMALVLWQASSNFDVGSTQNIALATNGEGYIEGQSVVFRCNLMHTLEVTNAEFISGSARSTSSARYCYHNWSGYFIQDAAGGRPSIDGRMTNQAFTKLELIEFPKGGTSVDFLHNIDIIDMSTGTITVGDLAYSIIPFDSAVSTGLVDALSGTTTQNFSSDLPPVQALTADEVKGLRAAEIKNRISLALIEIEALLVENQGNQTVVDDLNDIKTKLMNAKNLNGTFEQILSAVANQIKRLNINYLNHTFAFQ